MLHSLKRSLLSGNSLFKDGFHLSFGVVSGALEIWVRRGCML